MRGQLTKTDKALTKAKNWADRWRKEAKAQKRSASRAKARVAKLNQQLDAASAGRELAQAAVPMDAMPSGRPVTEPTTVASRWPTRRGESSSCAPRLTPED
jgi:predicted TPR repeat methyltransferase